VAFWKLRTVEELLWEALQRSNLNITYQTAAWQPS
jgi:hypothetical protein